MNTLSQKFIRKRKFLLVLPLLVLPFMTLMFWALDGGKANADKKVTTGGLELSLPTPQLKNSLGDKLSLYEQADLEARKLQEAKRDDPYTDAAKDTPLTSRYDEDNDLHGYDTSLTTGIVAQNENDVTEARLRKQLAALQEQLHAQPNRSSSRKLPEPNREELPGFDSFGPELANAASSYENGTPDPQLQQLDNMLNKILDIEHPERVKNRLQQESQNNVGMVYPVEVKPDISQADLLQPETKIDSNQTVLSVEAHTSGNAFYGSGTSSDTESETAITAVVHETQTLVSGATIKLRLTQPVFINGTEIPAGNFIYGTCSLDGERLTVEIKHIRFNNALLPVNLSVYDMDGMEGIHIPGAITRDAAKQGVSQGIQSLDFYGMDPSLGAQAASAGIQTAKTLLGGKAKLIKISVSAGYPVLLLDNNKHNQ